MSESTARKIKKTFVGAVLVAVVFLAPERCHAQGTIQITFDGPPVQIPGSGVIVTQYTEAGMTYASIDSTSGFVRRTGAGQLSLFPDNGTSYLQTALGQSLQFNFMNGSLFGMISVDLAEYSTVFQAPTTIQFVGYYQNGSTVTASFTTDGVIDGDGPLADFQTFFFDPLTWNGLTRVEIPNFGWSLDNMVVSVPEPSTWALGFLGGGLLLLLRRCNR